MKIYGLFGRSGTGKSHRALDVSDRFNINAIIDDGILIINQKHVAGISAKTERYLHAATKRAIFQCNHHKQEVSNFIGGANLSSILILGTSQRMITIIIERLSVSGELHLIPVESIQSIEEIREADVERKKGCHAVPLPLEELCRSFDGSGVKKTIFYGGRSAEISVIKPFVNSIQVGETNEEFKNTSINSSENERKF